MVKMENVYARLAVKHGCSPSYVRQIDKKQRAVTTRLAELVERDLQRARGEISRFERRVVLTSG